MKKLVLLALVTITTVSASSVFGQTVQRITFDEVLQIALDRSTALKSSASQLELESVNVRAETADFLPNLSLGANPSVNFGFNFDQTSLQLVNQTTYFANYGLNSSLNLFRGGGDIASLKQAQHTYAAADYTHDRTKQDVIQQAILNYLQVVEDMEQVTIQKENVEAQNQMLARIEEFTRVGTRPVSDLYQQQASLANAELQLLNAERSSQISKARLVGQLKLNPINEYEFVAPTVDDVNIEPVSYDIQMLIQNAFERRSDLTADRRRIDATRQGVRASQASYWPEVNLSAGYGSSYSSADPFDRSFSGQFDDNRSGAVRLGITVPIFNRFDSQYRVQQARVQRRNAELRYEDTEQQVALEVKQAVLDYRTAVKELEVTERQLKAAEQSLAAEQERYNVGASTLVELSQARATYVSAASNRSSAIYRYIARSRLVDYYVGNLTPEDTIY